MATHTHPHPHTHTHIQKEGAWRRKKKQQQKETLCVCKVFRLFCKKCRSFEFMILNTHTQQRLNSRFIHMAAGWPPIRSLHTLHIHLNSPAECVYVCDLLAYSLCPLCCTFAASLNMEINLEILVYFSPLTDLSIQEHENKNVVLPCPVNEDKCGKLHSLNWFKGDDRIAAMLLGDSNVTSVNDEFKNR